jgi:hypothetical protein
MPLDARQGHDGAEPGGETGLGQRPATGLPIFLRSGDPKGR